MKNQVKQCQNCKNDFTIDSEDFKFYEKINVPPPTFCPECRRQRRWAWRNNISLYNRKCDLCGKGVVSIYSPNSGLTIYCNKCWWGDKWDPKSFGIDYDFNKPFFEQFNALMKKVPHMAIVNDDGIASLNCEYTHDWWFSKNCYMCFSGWHVENVMYSFFIVAGKNIMDSMTIRTTSEWLYECFIVSKSYRVKYSELCLGCIDSQFLFDCRDCSNCFMCVGLRGKKYHFKNKKYSKEEYERILAGYNLDTWNGVEKAKQEFDAFKLNYPRKCPENLNCVNTTGEYCSYSKNMRKCFYGKQSQNCGYCDFFGDATNPDQDTYDVTLTGGVSECYECVVGDQSQKNLFGFFTVKSQDVRYTQHCHDGKHLFGCVGMKKGKYSILNKEYSKEQYQKLVERITTQMKDLPYAEKNEAQYSYGEFYPIELSPHGYNETFAQTLFPLTEKEVEKRGYKWTRNTQRTVGKETISFENISDSITNVNDGILDEVLKCEACGRNFKIVINELNFYRKMKIPIPRLCFHCRHERRLKRRNPLKLWSRQCTCAGTSDEKNIYSNTATHFHKNNPCPNEFETSYAPDRPEIAYCEKCYQAEVY